MLFYGVDVGGTKAEIVAYDAAYQELYRKRNATYKQDYAGFIEGIKKLVAECDYQLNTQEAVIGIGLPGIYNKTDKAQYSVNISPVNGKDTRKDLADALSDYRVCFTQDGDSFALSEAIHGAGVDYDSVFGAIIGTGVGGGYSDKKRLIEGFNNSSGEWGHISLPISIYSGFQLPAYKCKCGQIGCIENYISGEGIAALYQHFSGNADNLSAADVFSLYEQGDQVATAVTDCFLEILSYGLSVVVKILDPEIIVFGGGVSKNRFIYQELKKTLPKYIFSGSSIPLLAPAKFGDSSGTRGAVIYARQVYNL